MKKLLSILGAMTLIGTASTSVVACGNSNYIPEDSKTDNVNSLTSLLKQADINISNSFASLIKNNKNLLSPSNFNDVGNQIMNIIETANLNQVINDNILKENFFKLINDHINRFVIPNLLNEKSLNTLFKNVNNNNILKLNIHKLKITKIAFDYSAGNNKFGITNYNPDDFNIQKCFMIKTEINLELNYNHFEQILSHELSQLFTFYFSNDNAQINRLIEESSKKLTNNFDNYLLKINQNDDKKNLVFHHNSDLFLNKGLVIIKQKINDNKIIINNDSINLSNYNDFQDNNFSNSFGNFIKNKYDISQFEQNMRNKLHEEEKKWIEKFNDWKQTIKQSINNSDNIFVYGNYNINNWSLDGLVLKSITIPFVISRNVTRNVEINHTTEIMAKLWATNDGILWNQQQKYIKQPFTENEFGWYMNPDDFQNYIEQNKTYHDVLSYISNKIYKLGKTQSFINENDKIIIDTIIFLNKTINPNFNWNLADNKINNACYNNNKDFVSWSISINGFYFIARDNGHNYLTDQYVYKADNNIWP